MKKTLIKKIIVFIPITPFLVIGWLSGHIYEITSSMTEGYLTRLKRKIGR